MRAKPRKAKKSILHDYMRDAYQEFADLLCREIYESNPKSKAPGIIKEAVEKIMREHFGEDPGGGLEFD